MNVARILVFGMLLTGLATTGGCLLLAAGAVTALYVTGDLDATVDAPVDKVVDAAKAVVEEMELTLVTANATKMDGNVVAMNSEAKKVEIDVKALSDTSSKVTIRKGFFGDDAAQQLMMDKIKGKL